MYGHHAFALCMLTLESDCVYNIYTHTMYAHLLYTLRAYKWCIYTLFIQIFIHTVCDHYVCTLVLASMCTKHPWCVSVWQHTLCAHTKFCTRILVLTRTMQPSCLSNRTYDWVAHPYLQISAKKKQMKLGWTTICWSCNSEQGYSANQNKTTMPGAKAQENTQTWQMHAF